MKHFIFKDIREAGSCIDYAEQIIGTPVRDGRCVATWRDGERDSVTIDCEKWNDHAANEGGGLIELCARSKFGSMDSNAIQQAQEFLGEWLHLKEVTPRKAPSAGRNRHDELVADGFIEKARYNYTDLSGNLIYFVCRMEHPTKKKEFVQGTPNHWGISDITPIPYNWQAVNASDWAIIVEGEKDVETLKRFNLPATTNSGGAKKWRPEFSEYLKDKKVIILPDNDDVGREHADMIARDLCGHAASVKIVQCSQLPKGDVTDYLEKEGGTVDALNQMIADAPEYKPREISPVEAAKEANKTPFRNYYVTKTEPVGKRPPKEEKHPRQINELVKDLHVRLLGAPFKLGESQLFDQSRNTGSIDMLYTPADLFSWIARKTGQLVLWERFTGTVDRNEFFSALRASARCFESISPVPDYPMREDVFYTFGELPKPSSGFEMFWRFVDFFCPDGELNRYGLAALIMSPIFYRGGGDKPLWLIDSPDGKGAGKTTVAEMIAQLYGAPEIQVKFKEFEKNPDEIMKRALSSSGRKSRIVLIDNAEGVLRSAVLSSMVTARLISGRPAYGRGEENRPNNLTYIVTVNGATVDSDIASRALFLYVRKPSMAPDWCERLRDFIEKNRMQIFGDIVGMIKAHVPYQNISAQTRNPKFETEILQAACETPEKFLEFIAFQKGQKDDTNLDAEDGERLSEKISEMLLTVKPILGASAINPDRDSIFICNSVVEKWLECKPSRIKSLVQAGHMPQISSKTTRWPLSMQSTRPRGFLWNPKPNNVDLRLVIEDHGDTIETPKPL